MTDKRSEFEKNVDDFFAKVAEEAEQLPVSTIDIPGENHTQAGICLIADGRNPAEIDKITAAICAGADNTLLENSDKNKRETLPHSLSIEIERARFTGTPLSLLLIKVKTSPGKSDFESSKAIIKNDLHRVDIVSALGDEIIAVMMPETGGDAARQRAEKFLGSIGDLAGGCGIYTSYGSNSPDHDEFIKLALEELDRSCRQDGRVFHNKFEEPLSCQVTVEEKSELFNLFGKDKS